MTLRESSASTLLSPAKDVESCIRRLALFTARLHNAQHCKAADINPILVDFEHSYRPQVRCCLLAPWTLLRGLLRPAH